MLALIILIFIWTNFYFIQEVSIKLIDTPIQKMALTHHILRWWRD